MRAIICMILAVLIVASIWIVLYDTHHFKTVRYSFSSKKIKRRTVMVMLSDLHNYQYGRENAQLLDEIDRIRPDMIAIVGDMITAGKRNRFEKTLRFLAALKEKYPVYYAYGNHEQKLILYPEYYGDVGEQFEEGLKKTGIEPLLNAHCDLNDRGIAVYGLEIGHDHYQRFQKKPMADGYLEGLLGSPSDALCNVLLAHNPEYFEEYAAWGAQLVLAGHIHGGIVRLPLLGGVVSPAVRLFPKYDGGLFKEYGSNMILGRGIGTHSPNVRFLNPAELLVVTFVPGEEDLAVQEPCNRKEKKVK